MTVLALYYENLKAFPTTRVDEQDSFVHVFGEVVPVHDCIDLEFDIVLRAVLTKFSKAFEVCALSTADLDIGSFVERIT